MNQSLIQPSNVHAVHEAIHFHPDHSLIAPFAPVTNEYANLIQLTSTDTATGSNEPIYENISPATATAIASSMSMNTSSCSGSATAANGNTGEMTLVKSTVADTTGGPIDFSSSASSSSRADGERQGETACRGYPGGKVNAANGESKIPLLNWQICKNKGHTSGLQAAASKVAHRPSVRL